MYTIYTQTFFHETFRYGKRCSCWNWHAAHSRHWTWPVLWSPPTPRKTRNCSLSGQDDSNGVLWPTSQNLTNIGCKWWWRNAKRKAPLEQHTSGLNLRTKGSQAKKYVIARNIELNEQKNNYTDGLKWQNMGKRELSYQTIGRTEPFSLQTWRILAYRWESWCLTIEETGETSSFFKNGQSFIMFIIHGPSAIGHGPWAIHFS